MSMLKNIIILLLLVTNSTTLFYIYNHMAPEQNVSVDTRTEQKLPEYYYRITMKDGGVAEGRGIMKKAGSIDLIGDKITTTINNNDILLIEKVYYSTGTTNKVVTRNTVTKSYN